jgi:hypothetical protein
MLELAAVCILPNVFTSTQSLKKDHHSSRLVAYKATNGVACRPPRTKETGVDPGFDPQVETFRRFTYGNSNSTLEERSSVKLVST